MKQRVKTAQVRQKLGDLLDRIEEKSDEFVIERRGKPLAALVPMDKLERMNEAAALELLQALDQHARKLTQEQVDDLAQVAKRRTRPRRTRK